MVYITFGHVFIGRPVHTIYNIYNIYKSKSPSKLRSDGSKQTIRPDFLTFDSLQLVHIRYWYVDMKTRQTAVS